MSGKETGRGAPGNPNPAALFLARALGKLRADDDMLAVLDAHAGLKPKAIEKVDVATARANPTIADAIETLLKRQGRSTRSHDRVPGVASMDATVQGAIGPLAATVYTPTGTRPFPVIVYFHGGGWVLADRKVYDGSARALASAAGAIVVSVDYRQAPEHKFPAAWDDAFAAYRHVVEHAAQWGGNTRHVALAGESAGGNLALATAIEARDAGLQLPAHVLAIYPVTQTSLNTESYLENALALPLNRAMMTWFFDKLLRSSADLSDPRLQLIDARLEGLPPVTLINARIDPLRGDGAKLEEALVDAGVAVERREFDGVTHEFFGCAAVIDKARAAQAYAGERLVASFSDMQWPRAN
jgi:acetyl esterase/lipase